MFSGHTSGYESLIAALFSSPKFIYHFELGSESNAQNITLMELSAHEKASRLSYFLLQSMPDDALLSAADSGNSLTQEEIESHTERLIALPESQSRLTKFLADQIFKLPSTPDIRTDIASLNSMVAELNNLSSLSDLKDNMVQEVYDFLNYIIWEQEGGYAELMTSDYVFPRTPDLAEIYNSSVWNGDYSEASLVRAPAGERSGILTRAQQMMTGSGSTRSIMRGVRVYIDFLCADMPAPADTEPPTGSVILDTHSGREVVENLTELQGTSCFGCHKGIINPLGFPFESFDPLGRFRVSENIYHPEASSDRGDILTIKRVNTQTDVRLGPSSIDSQISDSIDLTNNLATSERAIACFNNKLWSFATKQAYHIGQNDCAVGSLYQEMVFSKSIKQTLKAIPLQPEFFQRRLQ